MLKDLIFSDAHTINVAKIELQKKIWLHSFFKLMLALPIILLAMPSTAFAQTRTCAITPTPAAPTSRPVNFSGLNNSGGPSTGFLQNAGGDPTLRVDVSAATVSNTAINHNVSGASNGQIQYNNVGLPNSGDTLVNTYSFERPVNIFIRGGPSFGGPTTAMDRNHDRFTFVAIGATAGFSWNVVNVVTATTTAVVSPDGLTLTIDSPSTTSPRTFTEFDIATNGQLSGVRLTHTTPVASRNNNARLQMHVPACEPVDLITVKTLSSSNPTPVQGDIVSYDIVVTNNSAFGGRNISLTDTIPNGLTATTNNGTVDTGSYNSSNGLWTIGDLAGGASATLTIEGVVNNDQGGNTITNITTTAEGDETDPTTAGDDLQEAIVVSRSVDLVITKTNTPGVNGEVDQANDSVTSSSTTSYTITVTNDGPDSVSGALVTDTPTSGLTCTGTDSVTISGDGVPSGSFTIADLTGAGITLGTLANGDSTTLTYSCTVN